MADKTIRMLLVGEDKSASKTLHGVGDAAEKTGGKLKGMGTVMGGVLSADLIKNASVAVVDFGKDSVAAYRDAAKSQRELEDAYDRFPAVADVSIEKMRELNDAIQKKTGADADDLASSQATMAQYGLTGKQIADLTPLLDDYAIKTGKDLPSAAEDLGKAMLGQGRALKDVGIDFNDTGTVAGNFDQVMAGLRDQVGGFAESEAGTAEGALRKLTSEFGDVQEEVGEQLLPILVDLGGILLDVIGYVKENADWLGQVATVVGVAAASYAVLSAAIAAHAAFTAASAASTGGLTVAQWALNAALTANPIGIVVVVLAALVAGLIVAYNESETFRNIVDGAFRAIGDAGAWLWNNALQPALVAIVKGFAWVTDGLANMLDALGSIPGFGWAKDAAGYLRGVADNARDAADGINKIPDRKTVNINVIQRVSTIQQSSGRTVVGAGVNLYEANGGVVRYYANGGMESHVAQIAPAGSVRVWAEPETGGEAYIPLAMSKRSRSLDIWRETGRLLGVQGFADGGLSATTGGGFGSDSLIAAVASAVAAGMSGARIYMDGRVIDARIETAASRTARGMSRGSR